MSILAKVKGREEKTVIFGKMQVTWIAITAIIANPLSMLILSLIVLP